MAKDNPEKKHPSTTEQFATFLLAAFGFVAGLAWNDAVQSLIKQLFPISTGSVWAKFLYAVLVTLVLVVATRWLARKVR